MEDQVSQTKHVARHCCGGCSKPIEPGTEYWIDNKAYCNAEHELVDRRYLRLCKKAREKAKRFDTPDKKGEIDYTIANIYRIARLDEFRKTTQ
jgi:hypothetical protein